MKGIVKETSFFSFELNFWVILLLTIVVLLLITSVLLFKRVNELDFSVNKLKEKIRYYDRNISDLKADIKKISSTPVSIYQPKTNIQTEAVIDKEQFIEEEKSKPIEMPVSPQVKKLEEVFYMPAPSLSGDFDISNKSDSFKETITLYKFFINKNNPNKADFEFNSDVIGIKNAVNYPDKYLESVCNINSAYNPNTKKIITERKGTAERIGDKWVVNNKNKAQIKYE